MSSAFRNDKGAIDLASVMVGIIIIGVVSGLIAATVFAVMPWSQDQAAKHQVGNIRTAQNAYSGMEAAENVAALQVSTVSSKGEYGNLKELVDGGFFHVPLDPEDPNRSLDGTICTVETTNSYEIAVRSGSGNIFVSDDESDIHQAEEGEVTCLGTTGVVDPTAPEGIVEMSFQCNHATPVYLPAVPGVAGFRGEATWATTTGDIETVQITSDDDLIKLPSFFEAAISANPGDGLNGIPFTIRYEGTFSDTMAGNLPPVNPVTNGEYSCLQEVNSWDSVEFVNASDGFAGYRNLTHVATPPATVTNMTGMLRQTTSLTQDVSGWNVTQVTAWDDFAAGSGLNVTPERIPEKFRP